MPIVDYTWSTTRYGFENKVFSYRVIVTEPVDPLLLDGLKKLGLNVHVRNGVDRETLLREIGDYEIIVVRSKTKVDKELLEKAARLKIIVRAGSGLDNIDVEEAVKRGLKVINAPEASVQSVAELTIALMIAAARRVYEACSRVKSGEWKKLMGVELYGKTLGVIGFGRIGSRVGRLARCIGMKVIAYDVRDIRDKAREVGAEVVDELDELLARSDVITIHVPLKSDTYHMISYREFRLMKNGVILVNASRGKVVDTKALLEAIEEGIVAAAALDVLENEPPKEEWEFKLIKHPRVIVTPHIGAQTIEAQRRVAEVILEKLKNALMMEP